MIQWLVVAFHWVMARVGAGVIIYDLKSVSTIFSNKC